MTRTRDKARTFIEDFIPKVSRTFALTIKFLPPRLRYAVNNAYLLCRVADTIEDSTFIPRETKQGRLIQLSNILGGNENRINDIQAFIASLPAESMSSDADHRLLNEISDLFEYLNALPDSQKKIIFHRAAEMAEGMAEYASLPAGTPDNIAVLKDSDDWDKYCYFVAGTVGKMLTELFIENYKFESDLSESLKKLDISFGLGLQKVNVIKDMPGDRLRGVYYIPGDIISKFHLAPKNMHSQDSPAGIRNMIDELTAMTIGHLDDAVRYTLLMPSKYRGVRKFLAVPVFLAIATLNKIKESPLQTVAGPAVKLSRADVLKIVNASFMKIGSNQAILDYYSRLRKKGKFPAIKGDFP